VLNIFFIDEGYERVDAEPCLYYKRTTIGVVVFAVWVDDILGNPEDEVEAGEEV